MSGRRGPPQPGEGDSPTRSPPRKKTRDERGASSSGARGARAAARAAGSSSAHVLPPPPVVRHGGAAPVTPSGGVVSSLKRYLTLKVTVKVSDLEFPKYGVRPVRDEVDAVGRFVAPFKDGKYGENENYISVALDPKCEVSEMDFRKDIGKLQEGNSKLWPLVPTQAYPHAKFLVVDGAHRVHALRQPSLASVPELQEVRVLLYARRDKRRMVAMDYVTIGSRLNDIGTLQNQTTSYDRAHSILSVIETVDEMESVDGEDEVSQQMRKFKKEKSLENLRDIVAGQQFFASNVSWKKLGPLCRIALVLHIDPSMKEEVKEMVNNYVGLTFVSTKALWATKDMRLSKITIRMYKEHRAKKEQLVKPGLFIQRITDLLLLVQKEFTEHNVTNDEGWDLPMLIAGATDVEESEPLMKAIVSGLSDYLRAAKMVAAEEWLKVKKDVIERVAAMVVWPRTTPEPDPDSPEHMEIDDLPSVPRTGKLAQSRAPAAPPRAVPASQGSESADSSPPRAGPASQGSESVDSSSEESEGSEERDGSRSAGRARKLETEESVEESGEGSEKGDSGDESESVSSPNRQRGKVAKKGPASKPPRHRVEEQSSPERAATPPPARSGRRNRRKPKTSSPGSESENSEAGNSTPQRPRRRAAGSKHPSSSKGKSKTKDSSPVVSTPEIRPDARVTRSSKRLQHLRKGSLKDDSVSEENGSIEETSEDRRQLEERIKKRIEKLTSLRQRRREGKGKHRHIRVPDTVREHVDSGDSSDCDTDFEEKAEPVKWRNDEFYIPRGEGRDEDAEGFSVRHSWEDGLYYVRPKPHAGVFKDLELTDPLDPSERAAVKRTGGSKEWWRGTLPDGDKDWLYPDYYSRLVQNLPAKWSLSKLPPYRAEEWIMKYKIPTGPPNPQECLQYNREALLRSLGFRPPHQSHFRLTTEDVLRVRWSVFKFLSRNWGLPRPLVGEETWTKVSESQFGSMRRELDGQGFLVIEGFILREETDNAAKSTDWSESCVKNMKEFFKYFKGRVPLPGTVVDDSVSREWSKIRNKKTAARKGGAKNARWQSTSWATNGQLETKELIHLLRARCMNEVACWSLVHFLHCGAEEYGKVDKTMKDMDPMLKATDSGSRVLITSASCERQRPHKDYRYFVENKIFGTLVKVPGMFSLAYGEKGGELWIVRGSHFFLVLDKDRIKGIAEHMPMERVKIPPWSLFLARGDFIHAGISQEDGETGESERLHDYYMSMKAAFYDNIDDEYEFKPPY